MINSVLVTVLGNVFDKYRHLWVGLLTLVGAFYLSAASQPAESRSGEGLDVQRVKVAEVKTADDRRELRFSGVTRAADRARLAFTVGGRVMARPVEVGDRVGEGQEIARLDDREIRNGIATASGALAELRARLSQAERDVDRAERLLAAKAATEEEVEKTRAGLAAMAAAEDAAVARLRDAERLLGETVLRAPYAGTVTEIFYEPGEFATPGRPVVTLSGDGEVELEVEVPETVVPRIEIGDRVTVTVPYLGRDVQAEVHSVGRTAPGPGRLFPVVARIDASERVVVGATAELGIALTTDAALSVPIEAVVNPGGKRPTVFRVIAGEDGDQVERIDIEVGSLVGDRVIIVGSLALGDRVVVGGQRGLLHGQSVFVIGTGGQG